MPDFEFVFYCGEKAPQTEMCYVEKQLCSAKILPAFDTPPLSTLFSSMSCRGQRHVHPLCSYGETYFPFMAFLLLLTFV